MTSTARRCGITSADSQTYPSTGNWDRTLANLCEPLRRWEKQEISSTELDESVHEVHHGSRRVFNLYQSLKADQILARSLASGLLTEDEVSEVVREAVSGWVKFYQDV